uniref:Uncharacterized protein n=1 Tax=Rhizophora mucronata TaxID=61149 RepID=A0A2P2Q7P0_RHIMU
MLPYTGVGSSLDSNTSINLFPFSSYKKKKEKKR